MLASVISRWRTWVVILLALLLATLSYGIMLLNQNLTELRHITEQATDISSDQARFRDNFSNYMNCLIVNEDEVIISVGEEAYVEICKRLLYLGIDPIPPTIKADPSLLMPTTTTTRG